MSPDRAATTPVAFLGLGTMGAAMAANLARAGFPVTAWNRTPGRAPDLSGLGVTMAATPAEAAAAADIVVLCVSDTPDVEAVLFGDDGVVDGARPGTLDHRLLHDRPVRLLGVRRAPPGPRTRAWWMRRSRAAARAHANATLTIFVGGDADDVDRARPSSERWVARSRTWDRSVPVRRSRR